MRIDTHLHVYADASEGLHDLTAYPIVEYGEKDDVVFAGVAGTVTDALSTLEEGGFDYAAVLGSFELPALPHPPGGADYWPTVPAHPELRDELIAYNRWLLRSRSAASTPAAVPRRQPRRHDIGRGLRPLRRALRRCGGSRAEGAPDRDPHLSRRPPYGGSLRRV